jgi:transposase
MVTLGSDCHKRSHTVVAVDSIGRQLGSRTVATTAVGHLEALRWARKWPQRQWAVEDCRQVSRRLESDLLSAGEKVLRVPPRLVAGSRQSARERGKSDPIDAAAVARVALREPGLPVAQLEGLERDIKLRLDHREDLVAERTRIQNRLRWHLHELQPDFDPAPGALDRRRMLATIGRLLENHQGIVARLAQELVERNIELTARINQLERELQEAVAELAPNLLAMEGCGGLTAAKIVGETAGVGRFRSRSAFAMNNGTAPIPVWSGNRQRFRLNRGGNRQLNAALHRIAVTQLRWSERGQAYVERRKALGNTKPEALRALKRRISDEVYRRLLLDQLDRSPRPDVVAA